MLVRIWRTEVDASRWAEYEEFEQKRSAPMFRAQPGCRGVLFLRTGEAGAAALTFWSDRPAIDALNSSVTYLDTVKALVATGLLRGGQSVEILTLAGGWVDAGVMSQQLRG